MPWPGAKLRGERGASAMRATTHTVEMAAAVAALVAARARGLAELRCCAATQRERLAQHRSDQFKYKLRPYTGTPIPYGRAILWMWYAQYSIV